MPTVRKFHFLINENSPYCLLTRNNSIYNHKNIYSIIERLTRLIENLYFISLSEKDNYALSEIPTFIQFEIKQNSSLESFNKNDLIKELEIIVINLYKELINISPTQSIDTLMQHFNDRQNKITVIEEELDIYKELFENQLMYITKKELKNLVPDNFYRESDIYWSPLIENELKRLIYINDEFNKKVNNHLKDLVKTIKQNGIKNEFLNLFSINDLINKINFKPNEEFFNHLTIKNKPYSPYLYLDKPKEIKFVKSDLYEVTYKDCIELLLFLKEIFNQYNQWVNYYYEFNLPVVNETKNIFLLELNVFFNQKDKDYQHLLNWTQNGLTNHYINPFLIIDYYIKLFDLYEQIINIIVRFLLTNPVVVEEDSKLEVIKEKD